MNSLTWGLLILWVALDVLIATIRSSLVNARFTHLLSLREAQPYAVDRALKLLERPNLRVSLRVMVVFFHTGIGAFGAYILMALLGEQLQPGAVIWVILGAVLGITLILLFLEFIFERTILKDPEKWAMRFAYLTGILDLLLRPLSKLLFAIHGVAARAERGMGSVTEDEIKTWVEVGEPDGGSLEKGERQMIYSIFQFGDTICREVMVPRIDLLAIEVNTTIADAISTVMRSGHSRLPVYEDDIDNIIGVLYAKDLLKVVLDGGNDGSLRPFLRAAYFVPESKKLDDLLHEMQSRRVHIAIVVDEYGGTAGMVTLEDIMEEIVGEIRDEYDQGEEAPYQKVGPEEFLFHGRVDLDDVNDLLHLELTKELGDTLAGYIYGQLGRVPEEGQKLEMEDWVLVVEIVSGRRIRRVRAKRLIKQDHTEEENKKNAES